MSAQHGSQPAAVHQMVSIPCLDLRLPLITQLAKGFCLVAHPNGPAVTNGVYLWALDSMLREDDDIDPTVRLAALQSYREWSWTRLVDEFFSTDNTPIDAPPPAGNAVRKVIVWAWMNPDAPPDIHDTAARLLQQPSLAHGVACDVSAETTAPLERIARGDSMVAPALPTCDCCLQEHAEDANCFCSVCRCPDCHDARKATDSSKQ